MYFCVSFVSLLLLYSSGPCYLHSSLTSSDVFTWGVCNATPWFTEEDNLCFRRGEAATARGVGFPSLLFTERGRFLLRSAQLQSPLLYVHKLICWQSNSGFHFFFLSFSPTLFLPSLHCIWFLLSLPHYLSFVGGLMWDCKWSSLTSISSCSRSICVAQNQPGHSLPVWRSQERGQEGKWNILSPSQVNLAQAASLQSFYAIYLHQSLNSTQ